MKYLRYYYYRGGKCSGGQLVVKRMCFSLEVLMSSQKLQLTSVSVSQL